METLIADIWQDVLGLDKVGVYDNFFDLGGHSLLSMKAIAQLQKAADVKITPKDIMFQTLGQLASACEERTHVSQRPISMRLP